MVQGSTESTASREDVTALVSSALDLLPPTTWWRILPTKDGYDDICVATGLDWEILLPLLLKSGLIRSEVRSSVKGYEILKTPWETFCQAFEGPDGLQIGTCRKRMQPLAYFIAKGSPKYISPEKQIHALEQGTFRYSFCLNKPTNLQKKIMTLVQALHASDLAERLKKRRRETREQTAELEAESGPQEILSCASRQVASALELDLDRRPRLDRPGVNEIQIHERKQANERERNLILHIAHLWGWKDPSYTWRKRQRIGRAACRLVTYDHGFQRELAVSQLPVWEKKLLSLIETGKGTAQAISPAHAGSTKYVEIIERRHPGYVRELFRYAQKVKGARATFQELADCMCEKSATPGETRTTLSIGRSQLHRWFVANGGRERSPIEKPLLNPDIEQKRLRWVQEYWELLTDPTKPVGMLDEKYFYTTSRRRKLKILPLGEGEEPGADKIDRPKTLSRRFPIKAMFMSVVGRPRPEHGFDGKIFIERVSKTKTITRSTANHRFSDDAFINSEIKDGTWRKLYVDGDTVDDLFEKIVDQFALDDFVAERLELAFQTKSGMAMKWKAIEHNQPVLQPHVFRRNEGGDEVEIELKDLDLRVRMNRGDKVEEDCSCNSAYMLAAMQRVGQAVRAKFHWVPDDEIIYLIMDNAGGHGTIEAVEQYTLQLLLEFNIVIIQQIPRSPETNVLDLGIWMALQALVERIHYGRRCDNDTLAKSVEVVWDTIDQSQAFQNVWMRLRNVLVLIKKDNGGNRLVESKRGKQFRNLDMPLDKDEEVVALEDSNDDLESLMAPLDMEDDEDLD